MAWCGNERARAWDEFGKHHLDRPLTLVGSKFRIYEDALGCCCAQQMLLENLFALYTLSSSCELRWLLGGFFSMVFHQFCSVVVLKQAWKVFSVLEIVW